MFESKEESKKKCGLTGWRCSFKETVEGLGALASAPFREGAAELADATFVTRKTIGTFEPMKKARRTTHGMMHRSSLETLDQSEGHDINMRFHERKSCFVNRTACERKNKSATLYKRASRVTHVCRDWLEWLAGVASLSPSTFHAALLSGLCPKKPSVVLEPRPRLSLLTYHPRGLVTFCHLYLSLI